MSDIDENQLLQSLKEFETELSNVREMKLSTEIENYQRQCQIDYELSLELQFKNIQSEHAQKKIELIKSYDENKAKLHKNKQQINKQLLAYEAILEDLTERKAKIEAEFQQNLNKLTAFKDKSVAQWKKSSNEAIKKFNYQTITPKVSTQAKSRLTPNNSNKEPSKQKQKVSQNRTERSPMHAHKKQQPSSPIIENQNIQ